MKSNGTENVDSDDNIHFHFIRKIFVLQLPTKASNLMLFIGWHNRNDRNITRNPRSTLIFLTFMSFSIHIRVSFCFEHLSRRKMMNQAKNRETDTNLNQFIKFCYFRFECFPSESNAFFCWSHFPGFSRLEKIENFSWKSWQNIAAEKLNLELSFFRT